MKPTKKNINIDDFAEKLTGRNRKDTINNNRCVFCNDPDLNFKDEQSRIEYQISGICQKCQDELW
jgi:hypothetical protein